MLLESVCELHGMTEDVPSGEVVLPLHVFDNPTLFLEELFLSDIQTFYGGLMEIPVVGGDPRRFFASCHLVF